MTERVRYRGWMRSALAAAFVTCSVIGAQAAGDDTLPRPATAEINDASVWRVDFTAADTGAAQDASPPKPQGFFQRIEITGFVDGYYGWNTNRIGPAALRNFDVNHNEFSLNMAEIAIEKKATDDSRGTFTDSRLVTRRPSAATNASRPSDQLTPAADASLPNAALITFDVALTPSK